MAEAGCDVELAAIAGQSHDGSSVQGQSEQADKAVKPKEDDIFDLARSQNFTLALKLLEAYPQHWTATDEDGHSLLHWAALVGSREFVQAALARGLPVDALANNGQTPLMWAVLRGHVFLMRTLLDAKAAVQSRDSLGATPLMIAIQHKQYACMLLLLHRGPKEGMLRDADANGCASIHWAAYKGDLEGLKFLNYFGADMQALDGSKMLPLHRAILAAPQGRWGAYPNVIEFLVDKRCDPTAKNSDGKSCLDIVEQKEDVAMLNFLKKLMDRSKEDGGKARDLEHGAGEGSLKHASKDKTMHKIFPVFWIMCVSMALFCYIMDQRELGWQTAPWFSFQFELGVPLSLAVFAWAALTDPGIIPPRERGASGVEEAMRMLDSAPSDGPVPDVSRLCTTTWVLKGLRTKYCTQTGACVEEFDHYCVWLNCAIGKRNHRPFVALAVIEFWTQVCHLYLCWCVIGQVPYTTIGSWLWTVVAAYPIVVMISLAHCVTAPWVFMLVLHQFRSIFLNLTTNEMMNIHRYEHFWDAQKQFRNPFSKGGVVANCLDFWWYQNRGLAAALSQAPAACGSAQCSSCR